MVDADVYEQLKQDHANVVAKNRTIMQRNLELDKRETANQKQIKQLHEDMKEYKRKWEDERKLAEENSKKATEDKVDMEKQITTLRSDMAEQEEMYEKKIHDLNEANALDQKQLKNKIHDLDGQNTEINHFISIKAKLDEDLANLQERVENEKALRLEQVNQKELDRIKETEQLRKEMLFNIKKTKANLLAMNDKQLQTTTHLTILQNHQLTTELEHQSKQTEILIFKNNKMK